MNTSVNHTLAIKNEFELIQSAADYSLKRGENDWISGFFYHCELTSVFQPISSVDQNKTIGHAAYIRSRADDDVALWPWQVFSLASKDDQLVGLDRLCRVIHALNYHFNNASKLTHLLVDVHPRLLESVKDDHGQAFENFLDLIGVRTSQVVIQIPANYSGTRSDWMVELGSLYPDIVRIDAYDLLRHESITELTDTIHGFGAKLLVGEVVTPTQLVAVLRTKVDYLQGNLLSEPQQTIRTIDTLPVLETISPPSIYAHLQQK